MPPFKKNISRLFVSGLFRLVLLLTVLGAPMLAAAAENAQDIQEISIAGGEDYPPFYFKDQEGNAKGWLIDIWKLWSEKTGIRIKFVMLPFGETLAYTKAGKVDVQGGCFYSKQRAAYLDYAGPLAKCDTHFFFHKNIYGIETLKDLMGYRIGVVKGDFAVEYLKEHLPGAGLAQFRTNDELFEAVKKGELRVFVVDTPVALYYLKKMRLLADFNYYPDRPLYSNEFRAAVKKGNTVMASAVEKGLKMITSEEKAIIERRWGAAQTRAEGVLTIACDRYYPPYTMLTPSGRAAGLLIDFWRLWSAKNVRKVEFVFADWEDSIQMVKEGKADFHSGLFETPEREEFLSFSVPIFATQDRLAFRTGQEPLGFEKLGGKRVGVITGSAEEAELKEKYPKISISPFVGYQDLLKALQDREIEAVYDVGVTLNHVIEDLGLQGEIEVSEKAGPIKNIHAGILQKYALRLKAINRGISQITEKELQDIEARWVPQHSFQLFSGRARPMVLTSQEKEWLKGHPEIKLGVDPGFLPFEGINEDGKYEGIASSYVSILNDKLHVKMSPVKGLSWSQVMEAAKTGGVDAVPCVVMTEQRTDFLQFTRPYLQFQTVVVTRSDAPAIASLKGLLDQKVAVVKDYYVQELLERDFPEIKLVLVNNIDEGLRAVDEKTAGAYVDLSASVVYHLRKLGLKDLKIAATTPYDAGLRFAVRKDWPEFVAILDKALGSIPETEREKIADHWINVRFAERTDWAFLIKSGIVVAAVIALILGVFLIWNRKLSREVGERKRAEERFQAIAGATPGAIIQLRFDTEGRPEYLYLSPKAEAFFGMPPEQVMAKKGRLPWHPEDFERIKEEVQRNLLAEADMNHVGRIVANEGVVKWVRLNASPSRNANGELIYNGFILDITERKLAEQEHIRSERKIKAMSQAAEDALIMIDGQGKVLFWNPAAEKLFGYSEAEAMGMDFHQMAAPEVHHAKIYKGLKHFAGTGEGPVLGNTTEINARNCKGEEFPVEVTLSSFQVDKEWFAVGTVRDISERKKAEEALKNSEQRMADLIDFMPDPILVVDTEGKVMFWNRAMERLTGVKKEDMLGKGDYEYALPFYGERRPILVDLVNQWDNELGEKYLNVRKLGDCLVSESFHPNMGDAGIYLSGIAAILYDAAGKAVGSIESLRDITARKKAEEAMRASEHKLKTILETADEGFQLVNTQQEIVDQNPAMCRIMGREKNEVIGKTIFDFVDEENKKVFLEQIELRKKGISSAYEVALSRPDGNHVHCIFNVSPLYDENNERIGAFAMASDISERKKAEEALKESEQRVQTILNAINTGVIIIDPEPRAIVDVNPVAAQMIGLPVDEIIGHTCHQFICPKEVDDCPVLDNDQEVENAERVLVTAAGKEIPILKTVTRIDLSGKAHLLESFIDISERKEAEEELKERLEELEQFNKLVVGRELKMISLKEEVNQLLEEMGQEEKYEIVQ